MGVINITLTASQTETVPGIPDIISITTSEPAAIFYTLDGTLPTTYSNPYVSPILMPQGPLTIVLNVVAFNQVDFSAVVTQTYTANNAAIITSAGDRLPHSAVTPLNTTSTSNSLFPFGTNSPNPNFNYLNPSDAGTTVYNQSQPATSSGFDGNGNPAGFTNQPISNYQFKQLYSTVNEEGEVLPGVGTLPGQVTIIGKQTASEYTQEFSNFADKIFNPRALVVFQDTTTEDPTNPVHINRPYFSLEDQEVVRDGNLLYNSTLDSPPTMGGFVNRFYNARTNMMTSYYYDNTVGRWIISTTPYQSTNPTNGALSQMVFSRAKMDGSGGAGMVFLWKNFYYRTLI
jgi:hypothetical protein